MSNTFFTTDFFLFSGFLLIALELFLGFQTGFDFVVIGSILLISGLIGTVTADSTISLISAIFLCGLYFLLGRNLVKQKIIVMTHKTNIDKLVGGKGTVIRSITPDTPGLIRLEDEDWRATSDQVLYEKDKIEVLGISGVTLKVKKVI